MRRRPATGPGESTGGFHDRIASCRSPCTQSHRMAPPARPPRRFPGRSGPARVRRAARRHRPARARCRPPERAEPRESRGGQIAALVAELAAGIDFDTDEYGRSVEPTEAGLARLEHALGVFNLHDAEHYPLLTEIHCALHAPRPAAPRRRLPGARRTHRHDRRVHRPRRAGPPLAGRTAGRDRSEGRRRAGRGRADPRLAAVAALSARLSLPVRDDRDGAGCRARVAGAVRARNGRRAPASAAGSHRPAGRRLHAPRRQGAGDRTTRSARRSRATPRSWKSSANG